ncbi:alpha-amylase family protein [Microbacterium telephonicum]|uniref:Amylosucrase n=1 Tax=Microbacterium telephonicum TaxID=1714841 RepID=A0A498CL54_9MICO|nr:alpha-amylase family protein [Microbacterium telephonicum]RLK52751.1 amylosucrase [Microbacterium telephonicum]
MTSLSTIDADRAAALTAAESAGRVDDDFLTRFDAVFPRLHTLFSRLYGVRPDGGDALAQVIARASASWNARPLDLKVGGNRRAEDPDWFQSERMLAGVCYVDRYGGNLAGIRDQIPYFRELGLTVLHLMPLFDVPEGGDDGGYAVSSYRRVNPRLGTMAQLTDLAAELRLAGISLMLDFVFNHTADDHEWARSAVTGDEAQRDFYLIFPDREMPDRFEQTTREIFPDDHRGSFVPLPDGRWVWSTFHHYQWDLNYANPWVFDAMAGEMLFLVDQGVELLRMDAVAFIWKRLGTACESLPEAHLLLQAFHEVLALAAPGTVFVSEAIVHPDEVVAYLSPDECEMSYNPLQMALTWEALATRDGRMLQQALERRHALPSGTAWLNYVRSHDDIGWTFADEDAAELGIDAFGHRRFLNAFYTGGFDGSFARGVPFQQNPDTGDARVAGTTASLAGIETDDPRGVDRVVLAHALAFSTGGVPLLYLGDEVAQLNDYSYTDDPVRRGDARWVHRANRPRDRYAQRDDTSTAAGRVFGWLTRLIAVRQATPEFGGNALIGFGTPHPSVVGFQRPGQDGGVVLVLANVGDEAVPIDPVVFSGFAPEAVEIVDEVALDLSEGLTLPPLGFAWLRVKPR